MSAVGGAGPSDVRSIIALRQQIIDRSQFLQQLHAPKDSTGAAKVAAPQNGSAPTSFSETLQNSLGEVNAVQARAEDLGAAYQRGEVTDVASVMLARQEAGVAFEATLQVRNKLLSAYQDIMRMGV